MFPRTSVEGRVLAIYDILYLKGPRELYTQLSGIVAEEAAAWKTAQLAGGFGSLLALAATAPDSEARSEALNDVRRSVAQLSIYSRAVEGLRSAGLSDEILSEIDADLRAITGGVLEEKSESEG